MAKRMDAEDFDELMVLPRNHETLLAEARRARESEAALRNMLRTLLSMPVLSRLPVIGTATMAEARDLIERAED